MNRFQIFLLHVCTICSMVCVVAKVLDWYNPYMDFSGHISGIQFLIYVCVFLQMLCSENAHKASEHRRETRKKRG